MKKAIEIIALALVVFLLATIDSYSTKTLFIGMAVWLPFWGFWMYKNRNPKKSLTDLPKDSSDDELAKWIKKTIKKIDKMGDQ